MTPHPSMTKSSHGYRFLFQIVSARSFVSSSCSALSCTLFEHKRRIIKSFYEFLRVAADLMAIIAASWAELEMFFGPMSHSQVWTSVIMLCSMEHAATLLCILLVYHGGCERGVPRLKS